MRTPANQRKLLTAGRLLLTSSSLAMLTAGAAQAQQVINDGDNVTVTSAADGETITAAAGVTSTVDGAPVVVVATDNVTIDNDGTLATTGVTQTIQVNADTDGTDINNMLNGVLTADSRVINVDGQNVTINNDGQIIGTGSQRNGTIYANRTANGLTINNSAVGVIDAGVEGAGVAIEVGGGGPRTFNIVNDGTIQGRGSAAPTGGTAGDGIRFFGPGLAPSYTVEGTITNSGLIASESTAGPTAGIRFANAINFQGTLTNTDTGAISGVNNGVYFGDADHTGGVVNNFGTISSDSRAFNIDGTGLVINNSGSIIGTGNQRNGTVYADSTAQDFVLNNTETGVIDAGMGNEGAGFSVELSSAADGGNSFDINNDGLIQGRGNASAGAATAGDGLRFERTRNMGVLDGTSDGLFVGNITNTGTIDSEAANGTAAGIRFVNGVSFEGVIDNSGTISGVQNGLYFGNATPAGGGDFTNAIVNNSGIISSGSRALNIDGTGLTVNNLTTGQIIGTGDQRNGTAYSDGTADDFTLNNDGVIDAGMGNIGSGFAAEVGGAADGANTFTINNTGTIQGRGTGDPAAGSASDGVRIGNVGNMGVFDGMITNSGLINSESTAGTTAGLRVVNGVDFAGALTNEMGGEISGVQNGLYFGTGDHSNGVVNNAGTISSDSRALNIDGTGLTVNNSGSILGTGDQRNGTVYADSTAQDFELNNLAGGVIDAGMGNEGAAFSAELASAADGGSSFDITNDGTIQGRGNASAGAATAGDGLRFERTRNMGVLDGTSDGLFVGTITNSGLIDSEAANGTAAGIRFVNGVSFEGVIDNSGTISGVQNGLYFGNPTPAGGGDFSNAVVNNSGIIASGSRALNIDGTGLTVNNSGSILGTGNQRNGTVYADSTAQNFVLNNTATGVIDAGMGNEGAGFSVELASAMSGGSAFIITNDGLIQGRGNASAGAATAGDGLRFERTRNMGVLDGTSDGLFVGDITNNGTIASEAANGTAAGIRFVNGVSFEGTLTNNGTISGVQNGLYFGNPTPAGGGDFSNAVVNNAGVISSDSRALNIDGLGLTVNNTGQIIGTGNQRNGTAYSDGTADAFTLNNAGLIDAGMGNLGSGFAAEIGGAVDGANTFTLTNTGTIQGRGAGDPATGLAGDGVRIGNAGNTGVFDGVITNAGLIDSESNAGPTAGLRVVNGVDFTGSLTNSGTISGANHGLYLGAGDHSAGLFSNSGTLSGGVNSVFAGNATAALSFVNDGGTLIGNFVGSAFADTLSITGLGNSIQGDVLNGVAVSTSAGSTTNFAGARTLEGSFTHAGTLTATTGIDLLNVDGVVTLEAGSVFDVTVASPIAAGASVDVLTATGTLTDNGTGFNISEADFLVDYAGVVAGNAVQVSAAAADLANISADSNINSFGGAITSAVANNRLPVDVFAGLNAAALTAEFEAISLSLLPAINDGVTREIFEAQRLASSQVQDRLAGEGTGLWGEAFFRSADSDPSSLSSLGYDADTTGFTIGLDGQLGETTKIGVIFNYSDIEVEANGLANAESEIDAIQIGAYAGFDLDQAFLNAEFGYSTSSVDNSRTALGSQITGESDVDGIYASLNVGYDIDAGGVSITPNGGLRYADLSRDSFTETGGLGLTLDSDSADFFEARIGILVAGDSESGVVPFASVDYSYDLSSDPLGVNASFNGGADSFRLVADEAGSSRIDVGAGLDFVSEGNLSVGAEYRGRFASGYQAHSGGIRVRFAF